MTQALSPAPAIAWAQALQSKLMAAIDAAWALIEHADDPALIRQARDRAKAVGEIAAMARKVALIVPLPKPARKDGDAHSPQGLSEAGQDSEARACPPPIAPALTQADHARRALDKLKGGRRGRL